MRVTFLCVGRLSAVWRTVWGHYESLVHPYFVLAVREVPEVPLSRGEAVVRAKEGDALLALVQSEAYVVALDARGTTLTSEGLSAFLADKKLHGHSHFQFILGGAMGLDERVLARADMCWSLSPLTFPHQMARCIVLEQLYRAARIERGEPYHY